LKHLAVLAFKFIVAYGSIWTFLGWLVNWRLTDILWISLLWAVASYLVGEWLILPRVNNTVATLLDLAFAFMLISFVGTQWLGMKYTWINSSLLVAPTVFIAAAEWIVHAFVQKRIFHRSFS
jgi:hypothetical protein